MFLHRLRRQSDVKTYENLCGGPAPSKCRGRAKPITGKPSRGGCMRRVVVTGLGAVTPIVVGKEAFWQGILNGKSPIGQVTRFDATPFNAKVAAEIHNWEPGRYFPPHRLKRLDRYAQFPVTSGKLALDDSGLSFSLNNT